MTLNEFLTQQNNTNLNLGFNRNDLPQLKTNDFLDDLTKNDIKYQVISINPKDLIPTQNEFNNDKIKSLVLSLRSGAENKPIMVSNDNYILDGHHRWAACSNIGCEQPVYFIDKGIHDIIDFVRNKNYAQYKNINESINEDSTENIGITEIDNMKRQLIDLLRLRVQNITPTPSPKEFSDILSKYSLAILKSSDETIRNDYNKQFVHNEITPLDISSNTDNLHEEIFLKAPNIDKLQNDSDVLKAHSYFRNKPLDYRYEQLLSKTSPAVFSKLAISGNASDRLTVAKYGPANLKPLLLTDTDEKVRAEIARDNKYHNFLMHDNSPSVKNNILESSPNSTTLLHLSKDKDERISKKAKEILQYSPYVSNTIKQSVLNS